MAPLWYADGPLVWIDLETSGLDPAKTRIMEVAVLITNGDLDLVDEKGFPLEHNQFTTRIRMHEWCKNQHAISGLIAQAEKATLTAPEVANAVLEYIKRWVPKPHTAQLAGSSIHFDAMYLRATGPDVAEHGGQLIWQKAVDHLHHRVVDVSSIKEICRRWYPKVYREYGNKFQTKSKHRALDDIRHSIAELKFYRETIFVKQEAEVGPSSKKRKLEQLY